MLAIAVPDVGGVLPLGGEVCAALITSHLDVAAGPRVFVSGGGSAKHLPTATSAGESKQCRVAEKKYTIETEKQIFSEYSLTEDTFPGGGAEDGPSFQSACHKGYRAAATGSHASFCV